MEKMKTETTKELKIVEVKAPSLEELLEAGVHFGHLSRRWHPRMAPYIFKTEGKVHIFDLEKTRAKLVEAVQFLEETAARGGKVIFVGTKRQIQPLIKSSAEEAGTLYVINRWLGGTLTNYDAVARNMKLLAELEDGLKTGKYNHYTKRERLEIQRRIGKLEGLVGGIRGLDRLPGALVIVDIRREKTALREARRCKIPVVAVLDSNCDPLLIDYPIPGNDDAARSVGLIIKTLAGAVKNGISRAAETVSDLTAGDTKKEVPEKMSPVTSAKMPAASTGLESLGLSVRSLNALTKAGVNNLKELKALTAEDLRAIKGLGQKSLDELKKLRFD